MAIELINQMLDKTNQMTSVITELKKRGRAMAQTESDYRSALAQKILILRAENYPVTIINDLSRGDREVAHLRLKRDIALTEYEVAKEMLQVLKLQVRVLQAEIERDYSK
jgi:multidrug resistance efflux pump